MLDTILIVAGVLGGVLALLALRATMERFWRDPIGIDRLLGDVED
jgi:hypothetical protein